MCVSRFKLRIVKLEFASSFNGTCILQKGAFDGCHRYKEYDYLTAPTQSACNPEHFNRESIIDCRGYYVVDDSVYASTLVADFGLFCDLAYKVPLVKSIFFIGVLFGAPAFGYAADYFGRKKTLLAGLITMGWDSIDNLYRAKS